MYTILTFVSEEMEEIETVRLEGMSIKDTLEIVDKTNEFMAGKERLKHEKANWIAVDFKAHQVEVMLKEIL